MLKKQHFRIVSLNTRLNLSPRSIYMTKFDAELMAIARFDTETRISTVVEDAQ